MSQGLVTVLIARHSLTVQSLTSKAQEVAGSGFSVGEKKVGQFRGSVAVVGTVWVAHVVSVTTVGKDVT